MKVWSEDAAKEIKKQKIKSKKEMSKKSLAKTKLLESADRICIQQLKTC